MARTDIKELSAIAPDKLLGVTAEYVFGGKSKQTGDDTQPDTTQPDTTQPDTTQPDTTQPDATQSDNISAIRTAMGNASNILGNEQNKGTTALNDTLNNFTSNVVNELDANKEDATANTGKIAKDTTGLDKSSLMPNYPQNFSKSSVGSNINNMPARDTLRNARATDAYNTEPRPQMMIGGSAQTGTGTYSLGTPTDMYEKPQLNTVEQRAQQNNEQLDIQRRTGMQDIQNTIDKIATNAYIDSIAHKYQLVLTTADHKAVQYIFKYTTTANFVRDTTYDVWAKKLPALFNATFVDALLNDKRIDVGFRSLYLTTQFNVTMSQLEYFELYTADEVVRFCNSRGITKPQQQYEVFVKVLNSMGINLAESTARKLRAAGTFGGLGS